MAFLGKFISTDDVRCILHKNRPAPTAESVLSNDNTIVVEKEEFIWFDHIHRNYCTKGIMCLQNK